MGSIITPLFISLLIIKTPAFSSTHDLGQAMAPKGNKEFKCIFPGCTSPGFGTLGAKQRHEREQHGGEQHGGEFKCDYCGYTAKRRYLIKDHMDIDHPDQKANAAAGMPMGRDSHGSIGSRSTEDSASSVLQSPPTHYRPFSDYPTSFNHSTAYKSSNQYPAGSSYAANAHEAFYDGGQSDPLAQSSGPGTLLGSPTICSSHSQNNLSFSDSISMNPTNQLAHPLSPGTLYQPGIIRGMNNDTSQYSSPYKELP